MNISVFLPNVKNVVVGGYYDIRRIKWERNWTRGYITQD